MSGSRTWAIPAPSPTTWDAEFPTTGASPSWIAAATSSTGPKAATRFHHEDKWIPIPKHVPSGGMVEGWWYEMIPTRDGHVEIEIPPGCYTVVGSMHTWFVSGVLHGNWATDSAIVVASCGADACVRRYASSVQPCHVILGRFVIPLLVKNRVLTKEQGDAATRALTALEKADALSQFERGYLELLKARVRRHGQGVAARAQEIGRSCCGARRPPGARRRA